MINITRKQTCLILALVVMICAIVGIYLSRIGREPPVTQQERRWLAAQDAFDGFGSMPHELKLTADQAAEVLSSLRKEYEDQIPELPLRLQSRPFFRVAGKYFAERNYAKSLDAFTEGARVLGEEDDRHVILASYLAGLSSRADWLEKQLESKWSKRSDLLKRFVRMNVHWLRKEYTQVATLGELQETTTRASIQPSETQDIRHWITFLRAKALNQIGRKDDAYEILRRDVLLRLPSGSRYYQWIGLHLYTLGAVLAEETGHLDHALEISRELINAIILQDKSWTEDKKKLYEMIERLAAKKRATVPTSAPRE